jgi:threonine dehydratase
LVTLEDIKKAQARLAPFIYSTPLIPAKSFAQQKKPRVYFKLENLQKTGSFKLRGAFNKISQLNLSQHNKGVITASAGNHAQGVACASKYFSIHALIVMPLRTPMSKIMATKAYGAEIILYGDSFDEAYSQALKLAQEKGLIFIPPFDDYDIIAGQGTIGLEIIQQVPQVSTVLVPVGGGGLIAGIAIALKEYNPAIKIIGVEAKGASSMYESLQRGYPWELPAIKTIADGIAVKLPGAKTFPLVKKLVDDMVLVEEEEIAGAILTFIEQEKLLVEGAGAVPLAALWENKVALAGEDIVLVISGGNIDVNMIARIIEKGLAKTGRLLRISLELEDVPGALNKITSLLAEKQANILHIIHDRLSKDLPLGITKLELDLETRGREHSKEIIAFLKAKNYVPKLIQ